MKMNVMRRVLVALLLTGAVVGAAMGAVAAINATAASAQAYCSGPAC